jgi:hypothetical protein
MADAILFKDNATNWKICLDKDASKTDIYAAHELQSALKKISNVDFQIEYSGNIPEENAIIIGSLDSSFAIRSNAAALKLEKSKLDSFAIYTIGKNLYLAGNNSRSSLYAVYAFLQKELGVRWFWPGDDGEFIDKKSSYSLTALNVNVTPVFRFREMTPCGLHKHIPTEIWMARNFLNSGSRTLEIREKVGFIKLDSGHWVNAKNFEKKPDTFSLINGSRNREGYAGCWSNDEFFKDNVERHLQMIKNGHIEVLNTFPADITLRCQCDKCTSNQDASSRWFNFYYKLIQELKKTNPDLQFAGIAYQEYRTVPKEAVKGLEYVEYCHYNRCYVHKLNDPTCTLNQKSIEEIKNWQKKAPMGIYGYEFDIFTPEMYVPFWNMLADEVKTFRDMKLVRMKTELAVRYPAKAQRHELPQQILRLPNYIYAQLIFDPETNIDKLLEDFCQKVYGSNAAAPMFKYHKAMADAWDNMKIHLTYFNNNPIGTAKIFLNDELIKKLNSYLSEAKSAIEHVADAETQKRYMDNFLVDSKSFDNWKKLYLLSKENAVILNISKGDSFNKAISLPMVSDSKLHKETAAKIYWSEDALHIKAVCHELDMTKLRRGVTGTDINLWDDDNLEIFLDLNDNTGYRHLATNPAGGKYDAKVSDKSWNINWDVKTSSTDKSWTCEITIPFKELGRKPKLDERWTLVFNRNSKPVACGFPRVAYHDLSTGAVLVFTDSAFADRKVTFVIPDNENIDWYKVALIKYGWNFEAVAGSKAIDKDFSNDKLIIINTYKNKIPVEFYTKKVIPALKNGAVVIFNNYGYLALDKFFEDQRYKVGFSDLKISPARETTFVKDDSFASNPHDMKKILKHTPPGVYTVAEMDKWVVLAAQKEKDGTQKPYLAARPYGSGMVVIAAPVNYARTADQAVMLLNNILEYNKVIVR